MATCTVLVLHIKCITITHTNVQMNLSIEKNLLLYINIQQNHIQKYRKIHPYVFRDENGQKQARKRLTHFCCCLLHRERDIRVSGNEKIWPGIQRKQTGTKNLDMGNTI